jgi:methionine synthase II (cobalamin-independent)
VRATELWRPAPEHLARAQDDATLLAIREQEDAGLNIVTDGEIRRESYSNHFATPRKQCEDSTSDESVRERLDEVSAGKWWSTASHEGPKNL